MKKEPETCPRCGAIINSYRLLNMNGEVVGCRACGKDIDAWGC